MSTVDDGWDLGDWAIADWGIPDWVPDGGWSLSDWSLSDWSLLIREPRAPGQLIRPTVAPMTVNDAKLDLPGKANSPLSRDTNQRGALPLLTSGSPTHGD